jgi:uncharacterized protein (DUF58 family)
MRPAAKFDYARRLAGALCYVGMVRLDGIELHSFSNKLGRRHLCTGGRHRFGPVLDSLTALEPGGQTDFFTVVREFITRYAARPGDRDLRFPGRQRLRTGLAVSGGFRP